MSGTLRGLSGAARFYEDRPGEGRLTIPVATLETGIGLRDRHLKGADFLDVERHPEITFTARRIAYGKGGHVVEGTLHVRDRALPLTLPVQLDFEPRIRLTAEAVLDRAALGLDHNTLGMIRGPLTVFVDLVLERENDLSVS